MRLRTLLAAAFTAALAVTVVASPTQASDSTPYYWRIDDARGLSGLDIADEGPGGTIIVADKATAAKLTRQGRHLTYVDTVYKSVPAGLTAADTYYGGYHTVTAQENHLNQVAAAYPSLTRLYDIGDSWRKTKGLSGGHDILALCVTKKNAGDCSLAPQSPKPRFSLIAQIHAREIATGELAWRFIDTLTTGYGSDARITALLDSTEVWIVPIANPDGVDIVASGGNRPKLQRKNANNSRGCSGTSIGVDLNRNSSYKWGNESNSACSETYQGTAAASEPEVKALESWYRAIHPDQRGDTGPAPTTARDTMITLHSYGGYVVVPWGYTSAKAPNDAQLRALGKKMAQSNGYIVGTGPETVGYTSGGVTDDYTYGALGVASFTIEVGGESGSCGGFLPAYSCVDSSIWPLNKGALLTAADEADSPYVL
ncbi:peptidase M14 [Actinorhabdospora filicis]|uniref:Zinc carboxypeptidase n=1 Tax=Actinorhabdospora filicis TaxID=1785913 RepID=A0A9W6SMP3_9ACTN|nr:M14 family zinc carboxypeptidase [Actinorhabdospora filicis]GLZ78793.1 peptidase M14 [Actinorhabdospora filicis]